MTANEGESGEYWATFYTKAGNFKAPEGTQVFKVKLDGGAIEMTEIADRIVTSGQGVVLKSTSGSITMTRTDETSAGDYSDNSLVGTMASITNWGNAYVLNKTDENGVGFYKFSSDGTIGANKAYLVSSSASREFFLFDEATGISSLTPDSYPKGEGSIYSLDGRRVSQPVKGLYIVNGKKFNKK